MMTEAVSTVSFDGKVLHVAGHRVGNVKPLGDFGEDDERPTRPWRTRRVRVLFESGWQLSVVWGTGTYSSNYHAGDEVAWRGDWLSTDWSEEPTLVEVAAFVPDEEEERMARWPDGDTVQGWVTAEELNRLIAYMATWPSRAFIPNNKWRDEENR